MAETPTTPAPTPEMVNITVNGTAIRVPKGMNVIEAAQRVGVFIPHYCYHPKLPIAGNCRMCMVEIGEPVFTPDRQPVLGTDGKQKIAMQPRLAIGCNTPVKEGMVVVTNSAAVKQAQNAVLEFLLINHPLDCPICDQAGECKLQEYSVDYGQSASRFAEPKVHKPKAVDLGPRIALDDERCILCTRCIRFTRDIAGDDALGIVNRGSYSTLTAYPGKAFDNNYTLNTVDICPVGALTSKDFRFQMRVWFLKESKSICTSCGTGCNIIIGSREEKVYRYTPRENDAVNACWICDYGRLNYKWIGREDRLKDVLVRGQKTTWPVALNEISDKLKKAPAGSVAMVVSARQTNEELWLLKRLADKFGALTDLVGRFGEGDKLLLNADRNPNKTGARLIGICQMSLDSKTKMIADNIHIGKVKTLIVFGEDVTKSGIGANLLGRLETLIVSDILPNETTKLAHYLLPGCAHAEKRGTFTNVKGRVQKFMKAVEPPGDARPEWDFLHDLVYNVTGQDDFLTIEGLFNQMAKEMPAFNGLTWASLGETGVTVKI